MGLFRQVGGEDALRATEIGTPGKAAATQNAVGSCKPPGIRGRTMPNVAWRCNSAPDPTFAAAEG
jgi:hypothetical protein